MVFRSLVRSERAKRIIGVLEGWGLALGLTLGGALCGYAFSEYRLGKIVAQVNAQHIEEIHRIQDTNQQIQAGTERVLAALAKQVNTAAQQASVAGAKAADAASESAVAAQSAKTAVAEARKRPVVVIPASAPAVPAAARANLRQAIEHTNRRIRKE